MGLGWIGRLLERIAEYLPDDEPATEEERLYEEGKQRIYELHEKEKDLFYAEQAWIDREAAKIYGESVKGSFRKGDKVCLLDVQGNVLFEEEILAIQEELEKQNDNYEEINKLFLHFEAGKMAEKEDFFARSYYIVKKH